MEKGATCQKQLTMRIIYGVLNVLLEIGDFA